MAGAKAGMITALKRGQITTFVYLTTDSQAGITTVVYSAKDSQPGNTAVGYWAPDNLALGQVATGYLTQSYFIQQCMSTCEEKIISDKMHGVTEIVKSC